MARETEIRAKLRVEDQASSTLFKIRDAFMGTGKASGIASLGAVRFARDAAAAAVGFSASGMVSSAAAATKQWLSAAPAAAGLTRQLTAMNAVLQGSSLEQASKDARSTVETFKSIGAETGASMDGLREGYKTLLETSKGSAAEMERAKKELGELAELSDVLDANVASSSREVGMMHEGILRTKGVMFQILQRTGIFGKDIKSASESWSKLTNEERAKRVAYGLSVVAGQVGKLPATWGRVTGKMSAMLEGVRMDFGEPLLEELIPAIEMVEKVVSGSRGEIKSFAHELGHDVGQWVREAAQKVEEGFKYLKDHQEEIRKAISEGVEKAREVVNFILAHKDEIAFAFGVNSKVRIAQAVMPALGKGVGAAGSLAKLGESGIPSLGIAGGAVGAAGTAVTFVAFAAAVTAFAAAVEEWHLLMKETGGGKSEAARDQAARKEALEKMAAAPQLSAASESSMRQFEDLRRAFVQGAVALGEDSRAAGQLADKAWQAHQAARKVVQPFEAAAKAMDNWSKAAAQGTVPSDQELDQYAQLVHKVGAMTQQALDGQSESVQQYIANVLVNSKRLRDGLIEAGDLSADGFMKLAALVEGSSKEFAEALRAKAGEKSAGAKPPAPLINMSGGQTFKIQQDFRDQDPDRVAIAFEEGIGRAVSRKISAGTSSPFGT